MMHRVKALKPVTAYAGSDFPRVPLVMHPGDEATVGDEMLAVLIDAGAVEIIDPEPAPLETKPEPKLRRRKNERGSSNVKAVW